MLHPILLQKSQDVTCLPFAQCTIIKFVLGGRFKESELFYEYKKRIGVL